MCYVCPKERESLNANMVHSINQASDEWGIRCLRYEIKDIHVPPRVKESMQMQVRNRIQLCRMQISVTHVPYFPAYKSHIFA